MRSGCFPFRIVGILVIIISPLIIPYLEAQNTTTVPVNVGLVFDKVEGEWDMLGAIDLALSDFYATHWHYKTRLVINKRDSHKDVVGAADAALDLIENVQVQAILGPRTSMQANFVIELGEKAKVPIITFTASSPFLTSDHSRFFFRAAQNDSTQANVVSAIVQTFEWREVVVIYVDNDFGRGILPYLGDALRAVNARIAYRSPISPWASDDIILRELYKLKTMQTRVFILHMLPELGSRLFLKAHEAGMVDVSYVWIITTDLFNRVSSSAISSMQGALGIKTYVPVTQDVQDFKARWKLKSHQENPHVLDPELDVYSLWAYDATIALALAVERAGTTNLAFDHPKPNNINTSSSRCLSSSELGSMWVSNNGKNLIRALSEINFTGLTGAFHFVDGQLPASAYQVVNVYSDGVRGIGFWTQEHGLVRELSLPTASRTTKLAPVIWPGEATSVPKGWQIPTSRNKLKVGVPVKQGFLELVNVSKDPITNETIVTGYSIDVFKVVIDYLPYSLDYEFIPFATPNGDPAGNYDDLVDQVYQGNYDAVVGDIAIRSNRSSRVEFTLPYTESGVKMVVPVRDSRPKNAWVFLKPLTWQLWLTIAGFFIWIGFVVWVLERRVNGDFLGPTLQQVSTGFWFSFSTMVFAHKEKVVSNWTRIVVVIWCFVVLILSQSYTASLASLLTVQQLQPTVTELNDLILNRENVGYEQGSYVKGILQGLGFQNSNLIMFKSVEDLNRLFQLGTQNGGVAAAFDDVLCLKLFVAQYCNKYTIVNPTFQTDGFGFVFPKGSPLVSDISKAILEVKEGDKMKQIEEAWLSKQDNCPDSSTSVASTSLDVSSFLVLFIITGVASIMAIVVSIALFFIKNKKELKPSELDTSTWSKFRRAISIYSQKDWKSFTAKNDPQNDLGFMDSPSIGPPNPTSSPSTLSMGSNFLERDVGTPSLGFDFTSLNPETQIAIQVTS